MQNSYTGLIFPLRLACDKNPSFIKLFENLLPETQTASINGTLHNKLFEMGRNQNQVIC